MPLFLARRPTELEGNLGRGEALGVEPQALQAAEGMQHLNFKSCPPTPLGEGIFQSHTTGPAQHWVELEARSWLRETGLWTAGFEGLVGTVIECQVGCGSSLIC